MSKVLTIDGNTYTYSDDGFFIIGDRNESDMLLWTKFTTLVKYNDIASLQINHPITIVSGDNFTDTSDYIRIRFNPSATNKFIDMRNVDPYGDIRYTISLRASVIEGNDWAIRNMYRISDSSSTIVFYYKAQDTAHDVNITKLHILNLYHQIAQNGSYFIYANLAGDNHTISWSQSIFTGIVKGDIHHAYFAETYRYNASNGRDIVFNRCRFNIKHVGSMQYIYGSHIVYRFSVIDIYTTIMQITRTSNAGSTQNYFENCAFISSVIEGSIHIPANAIVPISPSVGHIGIIYGSSTNNDVTDGCLIKLLIDNATDYHLNIDFCSIYEGSFILVTDNIDSSVAVASNTGTISDYVHQIDLSSYSSQTTLADDLTNLGFITVPFDIYDNDVNL